MAKCRVCGAPHRACGPVTTVIPVDSRVTDSPRGGDMTLKRYNVTVSDRRSTQTVLQLSDEDAKRAGLTDADLWTPDAKPAAKAAAKAAPRAANKARTPRNKAAAKPDAKAAANPPKPAVEEATDPGASE